MSSGAWGSGFWGSGAWGGGSSGDIQIVEALAIQENVIRLVMSRDVYYSGLLDVGDASRTDYFGITIDPDSSDDEGTSPPRAVSIAEVRMGLNPNELDLVLDRSMSAFPAVYRVSAGGIFDADQESVLGAITVDVFASRRQFDKPNFTSATPSRDLSGPIGYVFDEAAPAINTDGTGDYATDEGDRSLKKRFARRMVTEPDGFAHAPGYGLGLLRRLKKLARTSELTAMATDTETQLAQEPEVLKVSARVLHDPKAPALVRISIKSEDRAHRVRMFDFVFAK